MTSSWFFLYTLNVCTVGSGLKYFVAWQRCKRYSLFRFHGNTKPFCTVDIYLYVKSTVGRICYASMTIMDFASALQCYSMCTLPILFPSPLGSRLYSVLSAVSGSLVTTAWRGGGCRCMRRLSEQRSITGITCWVSVVCQWPILYVLCVCVYIKPIGPIFLEGGTDRLSRNVGN